MLTAGIPNLHSSLTDVHRDDFAHLHFQRGRGDKLLHLCVELFQTAGTYSINEKRCEGSEEVVEDKGERKSKSRRQRDVSLHAPSHLNLLTVMTARMDVLRSRAVWVARKPRQRKMRMTASCPFTYVESAGQMHSFDVKSMSRCAPVIAVPLI